ncbi:hypothetical protein pEaSNUABM11_00213 [Erwinia phage pEa_SNUABM_11]|nr:hypothetical protein pEaSNUABM11_00213 [Erwinia phage pEa_SNUABM_11]
MPKKALALVLDSTIPLYHIGLAVSVCPEAARAFDAQMDISASCSGQVFVFEKAGTGSAYIGVVFESIEAIDAELIAHEAVHAAWRCLQWVGITVDVDNQEALAYLVGWIAKEITTFVKPHQKAARRNKK